MQLPTAVALSCWLLLALSSVGHAGGGPERTVLVINASSPVSLQVGNFYRELRGIPDSHVLYLYDVPGFQVPGHAALSLEECQRGILFPLLDFLEAQELENDIDLIVYSSGFPYCINVHELAANQGLPPVITPTTSLTGITFFLNQVERGDPSFLALQANQYFRGGLPYEAKPLQSMTPAEQTLHDEARAIYTAGQYADSAAKFRALVQTYRGDPLVWYNYACCLALIDLEEEAIGALEKAVACGWSDATHTQMDPDFQKLRASIRGAEALRDLFGVMEKRSTPRFPAHGFQSRYLWGASEDPKLASIWDARGVNNGGYLLSVMLGHTGVHGNSVPEILQALESSAATDGTHPKGTVYFMRSSDRRAKTRELLYTTTVAELKEMGHRAAILSPENAGQDGVLPQQKKDVFGILTGSDQLDLASSRSSLLPGSICEHLTNYGAAFWTAKQAKVSEFVRYGAAGTSGCVAEPFAIAAKFPTPLIHLYYAQGCSLAESFYQSVAGPYQLLVVGDALGRPFAKLAKLQLQAPSPEEPWAGEVQLEVAVEAPQAEIGKLELWVNGSHWGEAARGESLIFDTRRIDDGSHEIRLVAVEDSALESRSSVTYSVAVKNGRRSASWQVENNQLTLGEPIVVGGPAAGLTSIEVFQGARLLQQRQGCVENWQASVDSRWLGIGRHRLTCRFTFADGSSVSGTPLELSVEAPTPARALGKATYSLPGARVMVHGQGHQRLEFSATDLDSGVAQVLNEIQAENGLDATTVELQGEIEVGEDGFYEVQVYSSDAVEVRIHDELVLQCAAPEVASVQYAGLSLKKGWHPLRIDFPQRSAGGQFHLFLSGADVGRFPGAGNLRSLPSKVRRLAVDPKIGLHRGGLRKGLLDEDRGGEAHEVPLGEVELTWKSAQRNVVGLALFIADWPASMAGEASSEAAPSYSWPREWVVEKKTGAHSWQRIPALAQSVGWDPGRGALKGAAPAYLRLSFSPTSTRGLRVRPAQPLSHSIYLTEVEVLERSLRKR